MGMESTVSMEYNFHKKNVATSNLASSWIREWEGKRKSIVDLAQNFLINLDKDRACDYKCEWNKQDSPSLVISDETSGVRYTIHPWASVVTQEVSSKKGLVRYWYKYSIPDSKRDEITKIDENLFLNVGEDRNLYRTMHSNKIPSARDPLNDFSYVINYHPNKIVKRVFYKDELHYHEASDEDKEPAYKLFFAPDCNSIFYIVDNCPLFSCQCIEDFNSKIAKKNYVGEPLYHLIFNYSTHYDEKYSLKIYIDKQSRSYRIEYSSAKNESICIDKTFKRKRFDDIITTIINDMDSMRGLFNEEFFRLIKRNLENFLNCIGNKNNLLCYEDIWDVSFDLMDIFERAKDDLLEDGKQKIKIGTAS